MQCDVALIQRYNREVETDVYREGRNATTHPVKNSGVVYMNCELNALGSVSTNTLPAPHPNNIPVLRIGVLSVVGYVLKVPFSGAFNAFSAKAAAPILKY